jgi:hypothetical protein
MRQASSAEQIYITVPVVEGEVGPAGEPLLKEGAAKVLSIFKSEAVNPQKLEDSITKYLDMGVRLLQKSVAAGFEIDGVTLHLAIDAKIGFLFGVGVEGAVDVHLKKS